MTQAPIDMENINIVVLKMEMGSIAILAGFNEEGDLVMANHPAGEGMLVGFRMVDQTPVGLLSKIRNIAASVSRGVIKPELVVPVATAKERPLLATFSALSGNVDNVDPKAEGPWAQIRRASKRITFLSSSADLRLSRDLALEVFPGVLQTVPGEIAVKEGDDWVVIDDLDDEDVAAYLLPRIQTECPDLGWEGIFRELLRYVSPAVAQGAIEEAGGEPPRLPGDEDEPEPEY